MSKFQIDIPEALIDKAAGERINEMQKTISKLKRDLNGYDELRAMRTSLKEYYDRMVTLAEDMRMEFGW